MIRNISERMGEHSGLMIAAPYVKIVSFHLLHLPHESYIGDGTYVWPSYCFVRPGQLDSERIKLFVVFPP